MWSCFRVEGTHMSLEVTFAVFGSLLALGRIWVIWLDAKRRPGRATFVPVPWAIWATLSLITLVPQLKDGAWAWPMLLLVANLIVNLTFFTLSLKRRTEYPGQKAAQVSFVRSLWRGVKGLKRADQVSIVIAAGSITLFLTLDNMAYALVASLVADFVGIVRTWFKALADPDGEVMANWVLALLASASTTACTYVTEGAVLQMGALESWYPVYAVGNAAIIAGTIMVVRRVRGPVAATPAPATEAA